MTKTGASSVDTRNFAEKGDLITPHNRLLELARLKSANETLISCQLNCLVGVYSLC